MNPKLKFLFSRRSIRKFTSQPVSDELLNSILEAAMAAPSAMRCDPWHFIVIREQSTRNAVSNFLPHGKFLTDAPTGIIVCGDISRANTQSLSYLLQDVSAAIENLLLAANALHLGCCWLGVHPREERMKAISQYFKLPEEIIPIAVIAIGHPAEAKEPTTRFRADAVHFEEWSN